MVGLIAAAGYQLELNMVLARLRLDSRRQVCRIRKRIILNSLTEECFKIRIANALTLLRSVDKIVKSLENLFLDCSEGCEPKYADCPIVSLMSSTRSKSWMIRCSLEERGHSSRMNNYKDRADMPRHGW